MKAAETDAQNGNKPEARPRRLSRLPQLIRESWRADLVALRNWRRRRRGVRLDYVAIEISGSLPERTGPPRGFFQRLLPLPSRAQSVESLNAQFERIGDAQNVRGALLILRSLSGVGLARLQNLRRSIERLQEAGKEVVVYSPTLDLTHYYLAAAADRLFAPPSSHFDLLGLVSETVYLKDALQKIGVEAEVLRVSPYKTAGNTFAESDLTPEERQQLEWLIGDSYDVVTADLARDRALSQAQIQGLIDTAPFSAERAVAAGLLDAAAYEDELPRLLAAAPDGAGGEANGIDGAPAEPRDARLIPWARARRMLMEKVRHPSRRTIGVVAVEGAIVMGPSRQPPVNLPIPIIGGAMAGEETIVQLLRKAGQDDDLAAVVVYVDSGGGSSLASDLIWREMTQVAAKKPLLAYMGNVAGSGGYYVSSGAQQIICQRSTITGSIGVILMRMNLEGLLEKAAVNRAGVKRGAHADLYTAPGPLEPDERAVLWALVQETYGEFKAVVSQARQLSEEELEPIAGGRVWTGRQALAHRLVDGHGDFVDVLQRAAELSGLPFGEGHRLRVKNLAPRSERYVPPKTEEVTQLIGEILSLRHMRALNGDVLALVPFDLRLY